MTTDDNQKQTLIATAEGILGALSEVCAAAQTSLASGEIGSRSTLAAPSNMMVGDARQERFLQTLNTEQRDHLRRLLQEPFVARVEVDWQDGRPVETLYFARRSAAGLTDAIKGARFISSGAASDTLPSMKREMAPQSS